MNGPLELGNMGTEGMFLVGLDEEALRLERLLGESLPRGGLPGGNSLCFSQKRR